MGKIKKLFTLLHDYGLVTTFRMVKTKISGARRIQNHILASRIKKSMNSVKLSEEKQQKFDYEPIISILIPLYNTDISMLKCVIESVINQSYSHFELCMCDGSDEEHSYVGDICQKYATSDNRIKYRKLEQNLGISENTESCVKMATGDYLGLVDHDDILHPSALYEMVKRINETQADFIYTDEVTFEGRISNILSSNFKPDYSKDTLRANNYICHFTVFSKELYMRAGGFRSEYDGSQDHDLFLRMTGQARCVEHIPKVLYFWRAHKGSVVEDISAKKYAISAGIKAVSDYLHSQNIDAKVSSTDVYPTIYKIDYPIPPKAKVSIIIPNKNHKKDLERCVNSILKSDFENFEIIIVENNSDEESIFEYYKTLSGKIRVITKNIPFNYSALNNYGVECADDGYIVFLNNDTEVINTKWIEEMLMFAARDDVGAVGARLFYPDNTLQHSYLITGAGEDRVAIHAGLGLARHDYGYLDRIGFNQNVNAVTGACMMVRKTRFNEVGGFDEKLAVGYNDVDLCLKLRKAGYVNVYTPFATLYHYESLSRGNDNDKAGRERLKKEASYMHDKWGDYLTDPYYNKNFSLDKQYILK